MSRGKLWTSLILTLLIAWGSIAALTSAGWKPKLGLDLQGGFSVVLTAPKGTDKAVLEQAVETMRRRIENLGAVQEPEISLQGDRSILVQLPGVAERERALAAVGTTGQLTFRPVLDEGSVSPAFTDGTLALPSDLQATTTTTIPSETTTSVPGETTTTTTTAAPAVPDNIDPVTGLSIVDNPDKVVYFKDDKGVFYKLGPAFLTGADMTGAEAGFTGVGIGRGGNGGWNVDPSFTSEGGKKFEAATAKLSTYPSGDPRRQMAIVLDGKVIAAPQIAAEVAPGESLNADTVVITLGGSNDAQQEAEDLATVLRYGALPTTFERESEGSISATLGSESLRAGLIAGIGGLLLVALAMILYYRALGLIAVFGLTIFGSLLMTLIILLGRFQGTTLTLAGITGIIVSVGITADSYIVFFERVKEEHRRGRALRPAVDYAFQRAFQTILTADTVTFVGSVLLWVLAIGPVKGFALTLGLATLVDVTVAYFYTRPAAMLLIRGPLAERSILSVERAMGKMTTEGAPS